MLPNGNAPGALALASELPQPKRQAAASIVQATSTQAQVRQAAGQVEEAPPSRSRSECLAAVRSAPARSSAVMPHATTELSGAKAGEGADAVADKERIWHNST